jgi:hypothetical protein
VGTPLPSGWESQVLGAIGAPQTPQNVANLDAWQAAEGGSTNNTAAWNPLNTTRGTGIYGQSLGGQPIAGNSAGVLAFPNWDAGLEATAATLEQPNFDPILTALRAGNTPLPQFQQTVGSTPWGTWQTGAGATSLTSASSGSSSSGAFGGVPDTPPPVPNFGLNPFTDIGNAFAWTAEFGAWAVFTSLVFLVGMGLLITGGVMIGVVLLGPVTGPAVSAAGGMTPVGRGAKVVKGAGRARQARRVETARSARAAQAHEYRMQQIAERGSQRRATARMRPRSEPGGNDWRLAGTEEPF